MKGRRLRLPCALRGANLIVRVQAGLFAVADRQQLRQSLWWFLYLGGIVASTGAQLQPEQLQPDQLQPIVEMR